MLTKAAGTEEICSRIPPRYTEMPRPALWAILCILIAVGVAVLYLFNPAQFGFYPTCIFYKTTGLLCPGCGTLRALHQLLHGHVLAAFRFNALIVSSLPFVGLGCMQAMLSKATNRPAFIWIRPNWLWVMLAILIIFGILRNLPGASRYFLAPLSS